MGERSIYSIAILAIREGEENADLFADAVIADSHDDARAKGYELAAQKYSRTDGYMEHLVTVCEISKLHYEQIIEEAIERYTNTQLELSEPDEPIN